MDTEIERAINEIASRQGGHLLRRQLLSAGASASWIDRRRALGLLVPVGPQTSRLASVGATARGDVIAACLEHGAVASHWTAAWLHGLAPRRTPIDVTVHHQATLRPRRLRVARDGVRIHGTTSLPSQDVATDGPIPLTSVARTLLGLAALVPDELDLRQLFEIVSSAVDLRLASDRWLWWLLAQRRCRGRNGVTAFETVLAERARLGPTESWLEREVLRLLEEAGLPLPRTQRVIERRGRFVARVDFIYDRTPPVIIEAFGYSHHHRPDQLEADSRRFNELQLLGNRVLQFRFDQVVQAPTTMTSTVQRALGGIELAA